MGAENLSLALDLFHYELFYKYKSNLKLSEPDRGFVREDCFRPSGTRECLPVIEYSLNKVIDILKQLRVQKPKEVHAHLRRLYTCVQQVKSILKIIKGKDEFIEQLKIDINKTVEDAETLFKAYAYKLEKPYRANNALLLATMLFESARHNEQANVDVSEPALRHEVSGEMLTLKQIAKLVCDATKKDSRNIQFIAIAKTKAYGLWITSNYHTPVIYPLDSLLSSEKYKEIENLRAVSKVKNRQLIFSSHIHAETMFAALKSVLGVEQILLVDGNGTKVENCLCCSTCLCVNGFSNQIHINAIQNYEAPRRSQLIAIKKWVNELVAKKLHVSQYLVQESVIPRVASDEARKMGKKLLTQMFELLPYDMPMELDINPKNIEETGPLEQIFTAIKTDYPFDLDRRSGLIDTYHLSKKLASPNDKSISRTVVRASRSSSRFPNNSLRFFDDGRIENGNSRAKPLTTKAPDSPRTSALVSRGTFWLKDGDPSVQFLEENEKRVIVLKR